MAKREMPEQNIEVKEEIINAVETADTVETKPEPIVGIVVDCVRLNIRKKPNVNASVVCEVAVKSKLEIDKDKSTSEWFKVCTETGLEGYCMRKYVCVDK